MIEMKPNVLYTRADLITLLEGSGVDPDFLIGRLKPRKRFRLLYWGQDLLDALGAEPTLTEHEDHTADPLPAIPGRKRGRPRKQGAPPAAGKGPHVLPGAGR